MTSKSGFFVFILIASGCLSKACGDGEIGTSPRSFEGAPTPSNVDEPTPDQPNVARPAGPLGDPYVHVTPADIGVTIGPGVIAPYPTEVYTGPCQVTTPNTTIENKIITCDTFRPDADNITIRNSVMNLTNTSSGGNGIRVCPTDRACLNFTIEYSHVNYPNDDGKVMNMFGTDFRGFTIRNSHVEGGYDIVDIEGNLDGMLIENNVLGPLTCFAGGRHADGFTTLTDTAGTITVRGNYVQALSPCAKTAFWFGGRGAGNAIIESNRLPIWGGRTLWASSSEGPDTMQVRYNIYSAEFQAAVGNRCNNSSCGTVPGQDECCGYPYAAGVWNANGAAAGSAVCNRYEDGSFVEDQWFTGVTHDITGCPDYP